MAKVRLIRERHGDFFMRDVKLVKAMLPFFEREGTGYVHRVRSASHIYRKGELQHTGVHFWCGAQGFLYPKGKQNRKHAPAKVCSEPSPGRTVCATCEGRAIGAGQIEPPRIGGHFVKFKPHVDFFPALPNPHPYGA